MKYFLDKFKSELDYREKLLSSHINTKMLQINSLCDYMKDLGYVQENKLASFVTKNKNQTYRISFSQAVSLHNSYKLEWRKTDKIIDINYPFSFTFLLENWNKAEDNKKLSKVKLQRKRGGEIIVQNHKICLLGNYEND